MIEEIIVGRFLILRIYPHDQYLVNPGHLRETLLSAAPVAVVFGDDILEVIEEILIYE
jgi:hypothetical protein